MKCKLLKTAFVWTIFCWAAVIGFAQGNKAKNTTTSEQTLPTVFLIGENDKAYTNLLSSQTTLLEVCDDDMHFAYHKLMGMMREMETYAAEVNFDLKGINAWMHFFWRPDGSIDHIGFYLKPNSKNVPTERFKGFLDGFAKNHKLPIKHNKKFSHYSSFSFPIIRHDPVYDVSKSTVKANSLKKGS